MFDCVQTTHFQLVRFHFTLQEEEGETNGSDRFGWHNQSVIGSERDTGEAGPDVRGRDPSPVFGVKRDLLATAYSPRTRSPNKDLR